MDLVLNLPNDGVRLVFDPVTQRLKVQTNQLYTLKNNNNCFQLMISHWKI